MITVKGYGNIRKIKIAGMLSLLLVIFIFSSCMSKSDEEYPYLPIDSETESETDTDTESEVDCSYRVIVATGASADVVSAADSLCRGIERQTGCDSYMIYDTDDYEEIDGCVDVLVGYNNRESTVRALYGMRTEDYTCKRIDGETVVIGGRTNKATLAAISRFSSEILPYATRDRLIAEGMDVTYIGEYDVTEYKLNGMTLDRYTIRTEDEDDEALTAIACELKNRIAEELSYAVDINTESYGWQSGGIIYIGSDGIKDRNKAYIKISPEKISLCASDNSGLSLAVDELMRLLTEVGNEGDLVCEISDICVIAYGDGEVTLASTMCGELMSLGKPTAVSNAVSPILSGKPDVVAFPMSEEDDMEKISENLGGYSTLSTDDTSNTVLSAVSCTYVCRSVTDGVTVDCYLIESSDLSVAVAFISGDGRTAEIPTELISLGYPIVAIVNTVDGDITVSNAEALSLSKTVSKTRKYGTREVTFECYSDINKVKITRGTLLDDTGYSAIVISGEV